MLRARANQLVGVGLGGRYDSAHHAMIAQMPHQCARVDLGQHRNLVPLHVLVGYLLRAPVRTDRRKLAHDQPFDKWARCLVVCCVGAVISNLGVGENDDLPGIGGIGGDFLVSGKGSIENNFSLAFARGAIAVAAEDAPVFERQDRLHRVSGEWIQSILAGLHGGISGTFGGLMHHPGILGRPIHKHGLTVDKRTLHGAEFPAIRRNAAVVAEDKVVVRRQSDLPE